MKMLMYRLIVAAQFAFDLFGIKWYLNQLVCGLQQVVVIYGVTRSRKIESDSDYKKNKERVQELKGLWKKEKLYSTINKYIETFDINMITSFYITNSHF